MTIDLEKLRALCDAATPGPWTADVWIETDGNGWRATGPHHEDHDCWTEPGCPDEQAAQRDAAFIVAAREVVPVLVAEVERLTEERDDDRSQRSRAVMAVAICQERIAELERELAVERNSLRAQFDAVTAERACPCLYTTPCHERCTCVNQVSSIGCRRCCSYGSMEQRKAMAERLVNAERETVERIAQWLASVDASDAWVSDTAYGDDQHEVWLAEQIRANAWKRGQDV